MEAAADAGADADALRLESRAQLLDAQSFRDRKSSELAAAEEAVKTESDRLATRVAELVGRLLGAGLSGGGVDRLVNACIDGVGHGISPRPGSGS